jgi:general secretion pathway protein A
MYTQFYNLKQKPFNLTPSVRSLYLGDIHKEALALLTYGVMDRKGFILLTGEVGTGKTTMVHALLNTLGKDIQYVYLSNPLFSVNDFMNYLAFSAFKEKIDFKNKTDFLIHFELFLKKQAKEQKNFTLIIDEAQKLSFELLEEIRLLSNLETSEEKLINIFLVGQPELNELLNQPRCRPLLQRISIRYHIKALDEAASLAYISTKLKLAGAGNPDTIIPRNAAKTIFHYSDGYPRMINILADNVLLLGYSRGEKYVLPGMVKECYDDLQLEGSVFDAEKGKELIKKKKGLLERIWNFKWAAL